MAQLLSFRKFLRETERDSEPPDLYQAASDELNTKGQIGIQVFDWVPFDDGVYRFGQAFAIVNGKDDDQSSDDGVIWIKPVTGKERGDKGEDETDVGPLKFNVMKCVRKHPETGEMMQIECPPLEDTKAFPVKKSKWRSMVNKPFAQQAAGAGGMGGGMGGMGGGLPGM